MAADAPSQAPADSVPARPVPRPPRVLALLALAGLLVFVQDRGRILWSEWTSLQRDQRRLRDTAVVGYYNISANPSYAQKPPDWYHHDGEYTLLWSGWKHGQGHRWFRVGRGEVERARISHPIGRDVIQAIDHPLVEVGGGTIWGRIPDGAPVVGCVLAGVRAVYPLRVLDKVEVVNDQIGDRPFLITYNPFVGEEDAVRIFDPVLDGRRVTMGLSGYFHDGQPMLYDRGTESLWVAESAALRAIAGRLRGARLRQVGRAAPAPWGDWRARYPRSRLLVGADRSRPAPPF